MAITITPNSLSIAAVSYFLYFVSASRLSSLLNVRELPSALKVNNGLALTPQMGWNSWNHFGCDINEQIIRDAAEALISSGLRDAGYNYVNVDDCWAELSRTSQGLLAARNSTFPSGIKALADYLHDRGLKFGIYSDAGYLTCAKQPGSLGYEKQDADLFASWGVDYLKYDNCYNDGSLSIKRYKKMSNALNATGRPILFSLCTWGVGFPFIWGSKVGNSWRTTLDIQDNWESMIDIADINNVFHAFAGPGGWNDADMLEVGNGGMSDSEYRVHFSLWAIMKSPLLIGCDIRNMSSSTVSILSNPEAIAINQDGLGVQGQRVRQQGSMDIWCGRLSSNRTVLAFVNRSPSETLSLVSLWPELSLPLNVSVTARDVWNRKYLEGVFVNFLAATVPPRDVVLLVLSPVTAGKEL